MQKAGLKPDTLKRLNIEDLDDVDAFLKQYISAIASDDIKPDDIIQSRFILLLKNHYNYTHKDAQGFLDNMQHDLGVFIGTKLRLPFYKNIAILLQALLVSLAT